MEANATATAASQGAPAIAVLFLTSLIVLVVFGNFLVIVTVLIDKKLRTVTTNKFIASLAVSDLLIGLVVMPLSLYSKMNEDEWTLGYEWCQFHLVTGVFSTTASIVHLVAISLDRYFAIMFPTEYQRHSVSTSTLPYVVIIWLMAFAVSSTLFMEQRSSFQEICWIDNPQYIVLSSFLSFFLPGAIVVYMYVKIFKKLRTHQLYMFGQLNQSRRVTKSGEKRRSLPRVIIEEVRSRRGSRLSQSGSASGSPTRRSSGKSDRSPSQPEIHVIALPQQRWRSPTICAETFEHDREMAAKKRVSIVPDPPSVDVSSIILQEEHQGSRQTESERFRKVSEERRKYSEERKRTNEERRKLSEDRRRKMSMEGAIPIMAAFNKAFEEVKAGRRRGSLIDDLDTIHTSLCPKLSTVLDTEDGVEMSDLSQRLSVSTEGQVEAIPEAHEEPVGESIDDQNNSLLCNVTAECPLLQVPPAHRKLRPVDSLKLESKLTTKPTGGLLMVPGGMAVATPPLSPNNATLKVPKLFECPTPSCGSAPSNSSHSSYTSASGSSDTYRRISMNSYGSSLTDATDSTFEVDSRRSSAWSTIRTAVLGEHKDSTGSPVKISVEENGKKASTISRGKLRRIATQVTRAIRRKRRESLAIRRESRATRVVAAILIAFLICWLPYFMVSVYRGICTGMLVPININFHYQIFVITSWLGYAHSCFNPLIYMCLNKNFRRTLRRILAKHREFQGQALA